MSPAPLDGIPPNAVTMPTRPFHRAWVCTLIAWILTATLTATMATAQQSGAPATPEPTPEPTESSRSVPEPDTLALFLAGASLLALYHVQRRRKSERKPSTA